MNGYTKHDTNIPINGTMLKKKAMEICLRLDITGLSTSDGWIDSFIKRQDFAYRLVRGESASVIKSQLRTGKGMNYHLQ